MKILNDEILKVKKVLPGEVAFKLYDTYGFPLDLTEDILKSKSLTLDHKKFKSLMNKSRELAKKIGKVQVIVLLKKSGLILKINYNQLNF